MAKLSRKKGVTSQILHIFIQDSSATTGAGLAGLLFSSAGLACKYINAGGVLSGAITLEDITTLGTYQAPTLNTNMRFKELNSASPSQGMYELHVHNDWMNLTGGSLVIMLAGATNMAQFRLEIDLQADVNVTHVAGTVQTAGDLATMITAVDDLVDTEVAAIKTDTAAILIDTAEIGTAGAGLTAIPWNAVWDAQVESEVDDALVARDLDHLVNNGTAVPAVTAGTYIDKLMDDGTAVYDRTTDSLQAVR